MREKIRLVSSAKTGHFYTTTKNKRLHPDAMKKVYMPMTNILLDTHDITMASVVRDKVDPERVKSSR
jgi:hypothetical protein